MSLGIWVEDYRPKTVQECVLPDLVKKQVQGMILSGSMPHLLFTGTAGTGKTSLGKAIANEIGSEFIIYNGSDGSLNIDELREGVSDFAQTVNVDGSDKFKVIIIDEADGLSKSIQDALRNAMEKYSNGCRFILTANYPDKISEALQSRCARIDFKFNKDEMNTLVRSFAHRLVHILQMENVQYDPDAIIYMCKEYFPDNRRIINEIQKYVNYNSKLDMGIAENIVQNIESLFDFINTKNYNAIKSWVANNNVSSIFNLMFKEYENYIPKQHQPAFIYCTGVGMRYHNTVPNQELNVLAALVEYMENVND
jgi:DNA polymerase III delta prime subunit